MPRSAPTGIPDLRFLESHDLVKLSLKSGQTVYLGSAAITGYDPDAITTSRNYIPAITKSGAAKQTMARSADKVPLSIQNVDKVMGLTINDAETSLTGANCKFLQALQKPNGSYYLGVIMEGELSDVNVDQAEVSFNLIADTAPGLGTIGGRPVQAKCPLVLGDTKCGWTSAQGGPPTCSKIYDDSVKGCSAHHNQARFQGIVVRGEISSPIIGGGTNTPISQGGSDPNGVGFGGGALAPRFPDPIRGRIDLPY